MMVSRSVSCLEGPPTSSKSTQMELHNGSPTSTVRLAPRQPGGRGTNKTPLTKIVKEWESRLTGKGDEKTRDRGRTVVYIKNNISAKSFVTILIFWETGCPNWNKKKKNYTLEKRSSFTQS